MHTIFNPEKWKIHILKSFVCVWTCVWACVREREKWGKEGRGEERRESIKVITFWIQLLSTSIYSVPAMWKGAKCNDCGLIQGQSADDIISIDSKYTAAAGSVSLGRELT